MFFRMYNIKLMRYGNIVSKSISRIANYPHIHNLRKIIKIKQKHIICCSVLYLVDGCITVEDMQYLLYCTERESCRKAVPKAHHRLPDLGKSV